MAEVVRCNKCGAPYDDAESIEQVKKWKAEPDNYAPCPNISCPGEMEVTITDSQGNVLPEKEANQLLAKLQRGVFYLPQR